MSPTLARMVPGILTSARSTADDHEHRHAQRKAGVLR